MNVELRVKKALDIAMSNGTNDGAHHKMWVIDQMVKALTGCPMVTKTALDAQGYEYEYQGQGESLEYLRFVRVHNDGMDGPNTYEWDEGITP